MNIVILRHFTHKLSNTSYAKYKITNSLVKNNLLVLLYFKDSILTIFSNIKIYILKS